MKRLPAGIAAAVTVGLAGATAAEANVIETRWSERLDYANRGGFVRIYVNKIQITRTSWKAWAGLTNNSAMTIRLSARLERPAPALPFTYWAAPGVWWSTYERQTNGFERTGTVLTHAVRGQVKPAYPTSLGPRKSWFGTFAGPSAKLPRDRLLRIGFGILDYPQPGVFDLQGRPLRREVPLSTTHQFTLPRRIR